MKFLILIVSCLFFTKTLCSHECDVFLKEISTKLNIPEDRLEMKRFSAGVSNHAFLITSSSHKNYVLKAYTKKDINEVQQIDRTISKLAALGFYVPHTLLITSSKDTAIPLQICEYISGDHVNDEDLKEVAHLMAKLHQVKPSQLEFLADKVKDDHHYQNLFKKCKSWDQTHILQEIYENIDKSYLKKIPKGLIHGDFSYSNLIKNSKGIALIDFDHICTSYLLTDLVRCQMFYGFDESGECLDKKIENFASDYDSVRPLTLREKMHFYDHMKLMMIDTALEMYFHLNVIGDLSKKVVNHPSNKMLLPDLLVKKICNLNGRESIETTFVHEQKKPVVFFGLSGVGKTTLIRAIEKKYPELFYIPKFTCTREPRQDDQPEHFFYVTESEFLKLIEEDAFELMMHEGSRYYGYQKRHLNQPNKYPLLNCSVHGLNQAELLGGVLVLIEGNASKGLHKRESKAYRIHRQQVNKKVQENFLSHNKFINKMNIIHYNPWGSLETSTELLIENLIEKLEYCERNSDHKEAA